jgi:hypothetical protein
LLPGGNYSGLIRHYYIIIKVFQSIRLPMLQSRRNQILLSMACGLFLVIAGTLGCSGQRSDLATVSGVVTLDGQPLPQATLFFQPMANGPASFGLTDESGRYSLMYKQGVPGAVVGSHQVKITTFQEGDRAADPPVERAPEILPNRYHGASELTAEVLPSKKNQIDFDLLSE